MLSPTARGCIVPSTYIVTAENKTGCKRRSGVKVTVLGFLITCKAIERAGENVPHKSYVVIKLLEILKSHVKQLLRALCGKEIILVTRPFIKKHVKAAPESAGPSSGIDRSVNTVSIDTVSKLVAGAKCYLGHLCINLGKLSLCPSSVFFKKRFAVFHKIPLN
jgi:hypothetical protein